MKNGAVCTKLGRVATLVESKEGQVWGRAFQLRSDESSRSTSLNYLDQRESHLGGYATRILTFYPRDPRQEPIPVLVYVALPSSSLYLGPASVAKLADEIIAASGHCGPNTEYVLKLAEFMKTEVPHVWDDHLFSLEASLRVRLKMDGGEVPGHYKPPSPVALEEGGEDQSVGDGVLGAREDEASGSDFASQVPSRRLRCLDL
ncbi:glutathione-specific gamma-glutamylcyclotransferase 1-like isoform X2 [Ornithodoros turicata]|uniref:glutathione-specific gamma-glutamylcyclotransferase 1-like isoform X2 n=1 Tax=Ornithodoros turicata TaxID=34597 RepID=UPI00313897AC